MWGIGIVANINLLVKWAYVSYKKWSGSQYTLSLSSSAVEAEDRLEVEAVEVPVLVRIR